MIRVIAIGECMIELSGRLGQEPAPQLNFGFGGDTLNTAVYLARALCQDHHCAASVAYLTALGSDPFSDRMIAAWQREGIDTTAVQRLPGRLPGLYMIHTDDHGERQFFYWRDQAAARDLLAEGRDVALAETLKGADLIYLSGISLAILAADQRTRLLGILRSAQADGARIAFDTNHRPRLWPDKRQAVAAIEQTAALTAITLPGMDDERALFGMNDAATAAAAWHARGVAEVVIKNGADPCLVSWPEGQATVPGERVATPVDTTAAGDSFNGAYLAARLAGLDPAQAAAAGHRTAARVIQHHGALIPR
jgi:2-dehydro-3-deoxygluconokinase